MDTLQAICTRKSVRSYTGEQVSDSDLKKILKAAQASPVGNAKYQTVNLTVITNKDYMARLDKAGASSYGDHPLYGAPVFVLVSSVLSGTPKDKNVFSNCACIVENMALEAVDLGLGTCHIWGAVDALNKHPELVKELNLPEGFTPVCGIIFGKSEEKYEEREIPCDRIKTDFMK